MRDRNRVRFDPLDPLGIIPYAPPIPRALSPRAARNQLDIQNAHKRYLAADRASKASAEKIRMRREGPGPGKSRYNRELYDSMYRVKLGDDVDDKKNQEGRYKDYVDDKDYAEEDEPSLQSVATFNEWNNSSLQGGAGESPRPKLAFKGMIQDENLVNQGHYIAAMNIVRDRISRTPSTSEVQQRRRRVRFAAARFARRLRRKSNRKMKRRS